MRENCRYLNFQNFLLHLPLFRRSEPRVCVTFTHKLQVRLVAVPHKSDALHICRKNAPGSHQSHLFHKIVSCHFFSPAFDQLSDEIPSQYRPIITTRHPPLPLNITPFTLPHCIPLLFSPKPSHCFMLI